MISPRPSIDARLLLKNIVFTLVVPASTALLVPYLLLGRPGLPGPRDWDAPQLIALPIGLLGVALYLACAWEFAHRGRGTPAPIDAPRVLVVHGPYRYVRNPMYLAVLLVILGQALYFEAPPLGTRVECPLCDARVRRSSNEHRWRTADTTGSAIGRHGR